MTTQEAPIDKELATAGGGRMVVSADGDDPVRGIEGVIGARSAPAYNRIKVDDQKTLNKYFLPYQVAWIMDPADLKLWEKSCRIGATWCQELKALLDRCRKGTDYLHSATTQDLAQQFITECLDIWMPIFGLVAEDHGQYTWMDDSVEKTVFYVKIDGVMLRAFTSSPKAVRGFGGDVGLDEIAHHLNMEAMMAAAGSRIAWGHALSMWSSHNGEGSAWNRLLEDERAKNERHAEDPSVEPSQWSIHRTTVYDAIEAGLVEKINQVSGKSQTREEWTAKMRAACGSEKNWLEEFECIPQKKGTPIVSRRLLNASLRTYDALAVTLEGSDADVSDKVVIDDKEHEMVNNCVLEFFESDRLQDELRVWRGKRMRLGYDVARTGDLSSIFLEVLLGARWRLVANILLKTCKFRSGYLLMRHVMLNARVVGGGDSTGLGMQTCEDLHDEFGERFVPVNFSSKKMTLTTLLTSNYEAGTVERPAALKYVTEDTYSLKNDLTPGGKPTVTAARNPLLPESHGDVAMSEAVAAYAGDVCVDLGPARGLTLSQAGAPADPRHAGDRDDLTRDPHYRTEGF